MLQQFAKNMSDFLITSGHFFVNVLINIFGFCWRGVKTSAKFLWDKSGSLRCALHNGVLRIGRHFADPFVDYKQKFDAMKAEVSEKKHSGFFSAAKPVGNYFARLFFGRRGIAVTAFNYVAPIISLVFLYNIVTYATNISYAVKLSVNGTFLGYVESEQVFTDAETILSTRMNYLGSEANNIELEPDFSITTIGYTDTLDKYQVADLMLQNAGVSIDYAYGLYINDVFYGAVLDNMPIKATLDAMLHKYQTDNKTEKVEFVDDISCDNAGLYLSESVVDTGWMLGVLTGERQKAVTYTAREGETEKDVARKLNMSEEKLVELNPEIATSKLDAGTKIETVPAEPFLKISVTKIENYETDVNYTTEYLEDNTLYVGTSKVLTMGSIGKNAVTARVSYVNDTEISRKVTSTIPIEKPVNEVIAKGIKPTPADTFSSETAEFGHFVWPIDNGGPHSVSEYAYWNGGYAGHSGIDIVKYFEAPIYAGDSGVVTTAGWSDGYGKYVVIAHPNGFTTLYGHANRLLVTKGQQVSRGQCIALMGATGIAQGTHVHFEVRNAYGQKVNPINYLDGF